MFKVDVLCTERGVVGHSVFRYVVSNSKAPALDNRKVKSNVS